MERSSGAVGGDRPTTSDAVLSATARAKGEAVIDRDKQIIRDRLHARSMSALHENPRKGPRPSPLAIMHHGSMVAGIPAVKFPRLSGAQPHRRPQHEGTHHRRSTIRGWRRKDRRRSGRRRGRRSQRSARDNGHGSRPPSGPPCPWLHQRGSQNRHLCTCRISVAEMMAGCIKPAA